ncbi:GNAT family N-acetyltransferase [Actinoplanes sp. RD1]|uniref:GNAT family N-acetyltransferase n=1 Tax=Actinoplanes sp. RD1 TaxID=3064538 RepID=UPI002741F15A|nr:GNAT family protein [Actinoplanes sp. RD1]
MPPQSGGHEAPPAEARSGSAGSAVRDAAGDLLHGATVVLRPATEADIPALAAIRATPEVLARWRGGPDFGPELRESIAGKETRFLAIEVPDSPGAPGRVAGAIQWSAEEDPDYRHATIDIFLDPALHNRGIGADAVRTLATHLVDVERFHRLAIDPAADNEPAIRCYAKVGFRPVGIMRRYERDADGTWHDGLLMDLLAAELIR